MEAMDAETLPNLHSNKDHQVSHSKRTRKGVVQPCGQCGSEPLKNKSLQNVEEKEDTADGLQKKEKIK